MFLLRVVGITPPQQPQLQYDLLLQRWHNEIYAKCFMKGCEGSLQGPRSNVRTPMSLLEHCPWANTYPDSAVGTVF